jgi:hypothetical protein
VFNTEADITKAAMKLLGLSGPGDTVLFLTQWLSANIDEIRSAVGDDLVKQARYAADGFTLSQPE